jgi:CheY-like chemotaxis protein
MSAEKKLVWCVDDDENVRSALRLMFRLLNYEFRDFRDPREAIRVLLTGEVPDILFLDINMPQMSGVEVLQFVRSRPEWKHIPILMVSSESEEEYVEQTVRSGADGYVFKPVNMDELRLAIGTAEKKRQAVLNSQ